MTAALLTLALALPTAPAPAPKIEPPDAGKLPPHVVWIKPARDGKFQLVDTTPVTHNVQMQKDVTVQVGGQAKKVTQTFTVPVTRQVMVPRILDVESVRFYGLDGKRIDNKEVQKRMTKDMPALLSVDGKPVDRFYLRLAREGTLVLVVPPSAAPPGGGFAMPGGGFATPAPAEKLPPQPKPVEKKDEPVPVRKLPPEAKK